jgi:putative glutamine amidotransferase
MYVVQFQEAVLMKIALTKGSGSPKYAFYRSWLEQIMPGVEVLDLGRDGYDIVRAREELRACAGIVFTGGEDVDPALYSAEHARVLCHRIDRERDDFELSLFEQARAATMPILGICRGAQLLNVALGGTLVADIPHQCNTQILHGKTPEGDSTHSVSIQAGTILGRMLRVWDGTVNSAHHQAIEKIGQGLAVSAHAPDSIIEAVEWADPQSHGFLIAVQWHPERMVAQDSPFARGIGERFLFECQSYELLLRGRTDSREPSAQSPSEEAPNGT